MTRFATNLHLACGQGAAKDGVHHWIMQRFTAIALIPLSLWFAYSFILLVSTPYEDACCWLSSVWNVALSILLILFVFYHGYLGVRVVFEDYIPHLFSRYLLIVGTKLLSIILALLAILSVLKVFLS